MTVELDSGVLTYSINSNEKTVLLPAQLGIELSGETLNGLQFKDIKIIKNIQTKRHAIHGKTTLASSLYNEWTLSFEDAQRNQLHLKTRLFDQAVAFRYELNISGATDAKVLIEKTGFSLPKGKAWIQPYDTITKWTPGYEQPYVNGIEIGTPAPSERGWCFPILAETADHWVLISESGTDENYAATHLINEHSDTYTIRFPESAEAMGLYSTTPTIRLPWKSPWRIVLISEDLAGIFQSDVVNLLNEVNPVTDYSWVKPGRASWSWWSDHESPKDPNTLREFIDLAAEMNWEYSLIDANWDTMHQDTLFSLLQYAKELNVGIWLWYNSGGPHNEVEEAPRDKMFERESRRSEMKKLAEWGIKGIKIDFFQSDKQEIIRQYMGILADAAEFKIMLNFHGCTLPRGWSGKYPHLLTMEAVRGAETYSFNSEWPRQSPTQNTIYPFTRNVTGPMDYTPVTLSHHTHKRITTRVHELALAIIFESGIQHFADKVDSYRQLPFEAKQYLKDIPVTWDESLLIEGYPGSHAVIARRKDLVWYIAGINGSAGDKIVSINFDRFPSKKNTYQLITDMKKEISVNSGSSTIPLKITLEENSGFVLIMK